MRFTLPLLVPFLMIQLLIPQFLNRFLFCVFQVIDLQQKLGIRVSGASPPKPVSSFAHFGFEEVLLKAIRKSEFTQPTPIQVCCRCSGEIEIMMSYSNVSDSLTSIQNEQIFFYLNVFAQLTFCSISMLYKLCTF